MALSENLSGIRYLLIMATISKRKHKRFDIERKQKPFDIEAYYRNESKSKGFSKTKLNFSCLKKILETEQNESFWTKIFEY
jgi:hypothetical protein